MPSSWCTSRVMACVCMPSLSPKHTTQTLAPLESAETNPSSCCRLLGVRYCHLPNDNTYTPSAVSCKQCFRVDQLSQKVQHKGGPNLKGLCVHLQALKPPLIIPHLNLHRRINPVFHHSSKVNEKQQFFHQYLYSNFCPTLTF